MSELNKIESQNILFSTTNCSSDYDESSNNEKQKSFKDASTQTDKIGIIQRLNHSPKMEFLNKKRKELFKTEVNYKKKPTGRKKKSDVSIRKHSKYSIDNSIYKIKNKAFNCVVFTINNILKNKGYEIKKVESNIFKDGSKIFNLELLKKKIADILLLKVSSKYSITYDNNNKEIIEKYSSNPLINEILNMTFEESIQKLFSMDKKDFQEKYKFENKYLFKNLACEDQQEFVILKNLIENGLTNHFEKIKSRAIRKEKVF